MAVIDIRGTNGSGKTWIMQQLLSAFDHSSIDENGKVIGYHLTTINAVLIGRYTATGGGCDGLKGGVVEVDRIVRSFHKRYRHILLEGIMVSHLYERFHTLADDLGDYRFRFLDTPVRVCIARVVARRAAKGNTKTFDPLKNLIPDYKRTKYRVRQRLLDAGHDVKLLSWRNPLSQILIDLEAKNNPPE